MLLRKLACLVVLGSLGCGSEAGLDAQEASLTQPPPAATDAKTDPKKSGGSDRATPPGGDEDLPQGEPLPTTPAGTWTWLGPEQFGNAVRCMDGSSTGLLVNRAEGSKKVLFYLRGAAACFDGQSCFINEGLLAADHFTEEEAKTWLKDAGHWSIFNRERPENPFKDYSFVFVPYCSGDVFAGDNPKGYQGRPQHGYKNVAAYLPRLAATYADATSIVLTGMSAGGYGATYNFPQVQKAFKKQKVTLINDSGPILGNRYTPPCLAQKWKTTWSMDKTLPLDGKFVIGFDDASGVAGNGFFDLFQAMLDRYPDNKFAFLSTRDDLVMRYFHGIGHSANCGLPYILSASFFEDGLREIRSLKNKNFSTFYGPGTAHPYFYEDAPLYDTTVDGMTLAAWLGRVVGSGDEPRRVPAEF